MHSVNASKFAILARVTIHPRSIGRCCTGTRQAVVEIVRSAATRAIVLVVAAPFLLGGLAGARTPIEQPKHDEDRTLEERKFDFERLQGSETQKLELQKLQLEQDKLKDENWKTWATGASVLAAFVIGIGTIGYQFRLKRRDFEIKAAEIIMEGNNPRATRNKALALKELFPGRFSDEFASRFNPSKFGEGFAAYGDPNLNKLAATPPASSPPPDMQDAIAKLAASTSTDPISSEFLSKQWANEIQARRLLFLGYIYHTSKILGQKYDVTILLMRHVWGKQPNQIKFVDVEKAEFYFGPSWKDVFTAADAGVTSGYVGVRISAWGSFWATCRVKFRDDPNPVVLHRHVDFEMPPYDA